MGFWRHQFLKRDRTMKCSDTQECPGNLSSRAITAGKANKQILLQRVGRQPQSNRRTRVPQNQRRLRTAENQLGHSGGEVHGRL